MISLEGHKFFFYQMSHLYLYLLIKRRFLPILRKLEFYYRSVSRMKYKFKKYLPHETCYYS